MSRLIKYCLVINIILIQFNVHAQDLFSTINLGNEYMDKDNYKRAEYYLNRAFFFSRDIILKVEIAKKLSVCYEKNNDYNNAEYFMNFALNNADDSLKNEMLFYKVGYFIRKDQSNFALLSLYSIQPVNDFEKGLINYYEALVYFLNQEFEKSYSLMQIYGGGKLSPELWEEIDVVYKKGKKNATVNPRKAKMWSMIFPGAGQLYNQEYTDALNSLAIVSIGFVLYAGVIKNYGVLQGAIGVFPWFMRYYQGGINNAYKQSVRHKAKTRIDLFNRLLELTI